MFIMLSTIVSASGLVELVGIVPAPGLLAASASSSSAALSTLCLSRAQSDGGVPDRPWHSASHAASDDSPYMKPTSCVSVRSWPKCSTVAVSAQRANSPLPGAIAAACHSAPGQKPFVQYVEA